MSDKHECKDCKKIFDKLSEYIDRELNEDECVIFEEHIKNCKPCLDFLESLHSTVKLSRHIENHEAYAIPRDVSIKLHDLLKKECKVS